ncbi:MAG TPA: hypothetical protein VHY77_08895 [Acidimicrobiales bacterium]|nr:hypothetical protein [Acidimicrobiales bacterium]
MLVRDGERLRLGAGFPGPRLGFIAHPLGLGLDALGFGLTAHWLGLGLEFVGLRVGSTF